MAMCLYENMCVCFHFKVTFHVFISNYVCASVCMCENIQYIYIFMNDNLALAIQDSTVHCSNCYQNRLNSINDIVLIVSFFYWSLEVSAELIMLKRGEELPVWP